MPGDLRLNSKVAPNFRGIGAGRYLLNAVLDYAAENGCCRVNLEVRSDNTAAQTLYLSLGFSACEPDMLFLEKKL